MNKVNIASNTRRMEFYKSRDLLLTRHSRRLRRAKAKLAENAGFGFDKMLLWENNVDFKTYIDFSDVTFYLDTQVRVQVEEADVNDNQLDISNNTQIEVQVGVQVEKLLVLITSAEFSTKELQTLLDQKQRHKTFANYIQPALKLGLLEMTIPEKPNSRLQKYRLTAKGEKTKKELNRKNGNSNKI